MTPRHRSTSHPAVALVRDRLMDQEATDVYNSTVWRYRRRVYMNPLAMSKDVYTSTSLMNSMYLHIGAPVVRDADSTR